MKTKLLKGYKQMTDQKTNIIHIYPKEGKKHWFDDCWCSPYMNSKKSIVTHNKSKQNPETECK